MPTFKTFRPSRKLTATTMMVYAVSELEERCEHIEQYEGGPNGSRRAEYWVLCNELGRRDLERRRNVIRRSARQDKLSMQSSRTRPRALSL